MKEEAQPMKSQEPDYLVLIYKLKSELETLGANSYTIFDKTKTLGSDQVLDEVPELKVSNGSILNEFYAMLYEIQKYNQILDKARAGLTQLVG